MFRGIKNDHTHNRRTGVKEQRLEERILYVLAKSPVALNTREILRRVNILSRSKKFALRAVGKIILELQQK